VAVEDGNLFLVGWAEIKWIVCLTSIQSKRRHTRIFVKILGIQLFLKYLLKLVFAFDFELIVSYRSYNFHLHIQRQSSFNHTLDVGVAFLI
jgi:hypothetical protein